MKRLLIALITYSLVGVTAQSPMGSGLSPKDVVDRLWKAGTEGELLTPDGWSTASRLFVKHEPFPAKGSVRIHSNNWGSIPLPGHRGYRRNGREIHGSPNRRC